MLVPELKLIHFKYLPPVGFGRIGLEFGDRQVVPLICRSIITN